MEESVFTKIIKREIPAHIIYEDSKTFAFLDIHPIAPGHTIVVPKQQAAFVWDLPSEDYRALMDSCQKIALHIRSTLNVPYVGVQVIGVHVPHAHVHLIPFHVVAEFRNVPDMTVEPDHTALAEIAKRLAF